MLRLRSARKLAKSAFLFLGVLFATCATVALAHTISFGVPSLVNWAPSVAATASAGFGTTSAIFFAMYQHFTSQEDAQSERSPNAAIRGVQQAWDVLDKERPNRNTAWVNAARLILRSLKLANELSNSGHQKEWALFVEEWKIRFLPFLSASHEYYFGYGQLRPFEPKTEISASDIQIIAESSYEETSLEIGGYSSSLHADTMLNQRAIRTVYMFSRIYDQRDDPIQSERPFNDEEIEEVSNRHLIGLFSYLKIRQDYLFFGPEVQKRPRAD